MPENQNIEYKLNWQDLFLKWICGFANAGGGKLYIGKDDNGNIIGIENYKKLMKDIPNKIQNHLGISSEVNLLSENGNYYIEIKTEPQSVAISFRGRYYFRRGSTNSALIGNSLNDFLLRKAGRTWDDVIEERASIQDIDKNSIVEFIRASKKSNRLPDTDGLNTKDILEKLRLIENNKIKRAAIILFGKDPGKFYSNISVKIGRFGKTEDDLMFHDIEEGNLLHLFKEVPLQLNRKYFKNPIDFEGLQRIEKGEYPTAAIREMLLNALVHKNYMGSTIQIRIYDDKIDIWNEGTLPEGLTLESLKEKHPSRPRNPIIADVCFKGGYIDAWGRGTLKIINACKEAELPDPSMKELDGGFSVTVFKDNLSEEQLRKLDLNERQINAILFVKENGKIINKEFQKIADISERTASRDLAELVSRAFFEQIGTTGKGTYYILRSHKDAKDATKKP